MRAWSGPAGTAPADGAGTRLFGVYPAIVETLVDPDGLGRVEVSLPWLGDRDGDGAVTAWPTLGTPYADEDQGLEIVPEKGSQVLVAFEAGDARRPYVLGACWNGRARLPEAPTAANDKRVLRTREGSLLEFDDDGVAGAVDGDVVSALAGWGRDPNRPHVPRHRLHRPLQEREHARGDRPGGFLENPAH